MPVTTLDPKTALILVDLQKGVVAMPTAHPTTEVVEKAARLAGAFRRHHLPVVLVNVAGGAPGRIEAPRPTQEMPADWTDIVAALEPQPEDHRVTKMRWGAFTGTDLESWLRENGVTQIVLAGVATSIGVELTARFAHELGFHVTFAVDAMTDLHADAHLNSLARIFPRLGETGSTDDILAVLEASRC